jgi:hypothetical protein
VYQFKVPPEVVADNELVPPTLMVDEPVTETDGVGGVLETVNDDGLVPVPPKLVTEIVPEVAAGTVAVICVELTTVYEAETPLKETPVTLLKFVPLIVMVLPTHDEAGLNEVTVGDGNVKLILSTAAGGVLPKEPSFLHSKIKRIVELANELKSKLLLV